MLVEEATQVVELMYQESFSEKASFCCQHSHPIVDHIRTCVVTQTTEHVQQLMTTRRVILASNFYMHVIHPPGAFLGEFFEEVLQYANRISASVI